MGQLNRKKPPMSRLFFRYLLAVGGSFLLAVALTLGLFFGMIAAGLLLPANTAEVQLSAQTAALESGSAPEELPSYYRWAVLGRDGTLLRTSPNLTHRRLNQLKTALETGQSTVSAFPFSQFHRAVNLPSGALCVVQYDYSVPYTVDWMARHLPDWQVLTVFLLGALWLLAVLFWTRWYARRLGRDAAALTAAARAIQARRLDAPFCQQTSVREFDETQQAMDLLRSSLSASLREQWKLEEQRSREVTALTHDLKTPLTVISGNSELLAEEADSLSPAQRRSVEAIVRNAEKMTAYLTQLHALSVPGAPAALRETADLAALFAGWAAMGRELCEAKSIRFLTDPPPAVSCRFEAQSVSRAVQNLLDNAVRYTPAGGTVRLSAAAADGLLTLTVEDSGPGFTPEALARGCERFYTENAGRSAGSNLGMGLYYAQTVARRHGGGVTLANTPRGGAVTLRLSLTEETESPRYPL